MDKAYIIPMAIGIQLLLLFGNGQYFNNTIVLMLSISIAIISFRLGAEEDK
jgi:hypothetical protein